jgi:hypothetical protein
MRSYLIDGDDGIWPWRLIGLCKGHRCKTRGVTVSVTVSSGITRI